MAWRSGGPRRRIGMRLQAVVVAAYADHVEAPPPGSPRLAAPSSASMSLGRTSQAQVVTSEQPLLAPASARIASRSITLSAMAVSSGVCEMKNSRS